MPYGYKVANDPIEQDLHSLPLSHCQITNLWRLPKDAKSRQILKSKCYKIYFNLLQYSTGLGSRIIYSNFDNINTQCFFLVFPLSSSYEQTYMYLDIDYRNVLSYYLAGARELVLKLLSAIILGAIRRYVIIGSKI